MEFDGWIQNLEVCETIGGIENFLSLYRPVRSEVLNLFAMSPLFSLFALFAFVALFPFIRLVIDS